MYPTARTASGSDGSARSLGQAIPEFALVLPVLLLLMLAAVDFGRIFFSYVAVRNAASQGAAYAAAAPTDTSGIGARVRQEANVQAQGGEGALTVGVDCVDGFSGSAMDCSSAPGGSGPGNRVKVTVTELFTFLTPFMNDFFGGGLTMTSSATATVLGLAPGSASDQPSGCSTPSAFFTVAVTDLYTVTVDASASTPSTGQWAISSYAWDMGDGADPFPPITGRTATYTYAASPSAIYNIKLTVQNQCGSSTAARAVIIGSSASPAPSASVGPSAAPTATPAPTGTPVPGCTTVPTFTYAFTGHGNGTQRHQTTFYGAYTGVPAPSAWNWSFGDSHTATGQTVSNNYSSQGTYTVRLTVTLPGCAAQSYQLSVAVP